MLKSDPPGRSNYRLPARLSWFSLITLILLFQTDAMAQSDSMITRHLAWHGSEAQLAQISSIMAKGTIEIKTLGLTFPFNVKSKDELLRFEQEQLQRGMDIMPAIVRLINDKAWAIIDERSLQRGLNVRNHGKKALQLWNESEFVFPTPILHLVRKGYNIPAANKLADGTFEINLKLPSGEFGIFRFDPSGKLLTHEFTGYHIQLGKVKVIRTFLSYQEKEGIRYPNEWIDNRSGLELHYKIAEIEFNKVDDADFTIPRKSNESYVSEGTAQNILKVYIEQLAKRSPFQGKTQLLNQKRDEILTSLKKKGNLTSHQLGEVLTEEIIKLTGDHHFGIAFNPDLYTQLSNGQRGPDNNDYFDRLATRTRAQNYFFSDISLQNGLFYFHLSEFGLLETTKAYFDSLMHEAEQASGIIIDLRSNSGGNGDFAHYMASYFLPESLPLYTNVTTSGKRVIYAMSTSASKKHRSIPLYILVNQTTVSAGELVPYLLQNHDRAVVIGATTYGAAHPTIDTPLASGFIGFMPVAFAEHIKTGKDWEGTGVVPDISCQGENALKAALDLAKKQ